MSDPTGTIASPHSVIENSGDPDVPPDALLRLLAELDPGTVVLGIPRHMDGSEGEMATEARAFGRALEEQSGVPVEEWDERLTTAAADRALLHSGAPRGRRAKKGSSDMMAAALMLRAYLASP